MTEKFTKGEMHGCIVCGKLYQLYVVNNADGMYMYGKVMSNGGKLVPHSKRPLVACEKHTEEQITLAVMKTYGAQKEDDD